MSEPAEGPVNAPYRRVQSVKAHIEFLCSQYDSLMEAYAQNTDYAQNLRNRAVQSDREADSFLDKAIDMKNIIDALREMEQILEERANNQPG